MREILFRGKRVDNGEWVKGDFIQWKHFNGKKYVNCYAITPREQGVILVTPQSIGQFTGLTDKSGNRIFEGDIVVVTFHDGDIRKYFITCNPDCFTINGHSQSISQLMSIGCFFEVIGNIHDNKEFLQ